MSSIPGNDDVDPEILYAAALGVTLARMRAELSEHAVKRIIRFVLDRYGIETGSGDFPIRTLPAPPLPAPPLKTGATFAEVFPDAPLPAPPSAAPPNRKPIHTDTCPICERTGINSTGLNMHMFRAHGTTLKEYRQTQALDG